MNSAPSGLEGADQIYYLTMKWTCSLLLLITFLTCADNNSITDNGGATLRETENNRIIQTNKPVLDGGQLVTVYNKNYQYRARPFSGMIQQLNFDNGNVRNFMLPSEGPDAIRRVNAFLVDEKEEMIVFSDHSIYNFTASGELAQKVRFYPSHQGLSLERPYIVRVDSNHPVYSFRKKYLVALEREDADKFSFPYHYQGSILGLVNVKDQKIEKLPLEWESTNSFYGGLHAIHYTLIENLIVYGFNYSPNIYTYSLDSGKQLEIEIPDILDRANEAFTGSQDPSEAVAHIGKSISYGELKFDEYNMKYYQLCRVPVDEGEPGFGRARRFYIRVFSQAFQLLGEKRLPGYFADETFCADGKFFIRYTKGVDEDELLFKSFALGEED